MQVVYTSDRTDASDVNMLATKAEPATESHTVETAPKEEHRCDEKQRSLVHQIFGGKMTTVYRCLACGTESHHQDFFTDLHLAFPSHSNALSPTPDIGELTIDRLLENYLLPEKLAGDNRYQVFCSFKNKRFF